MMNGYRYKVLCKVVGFDLSKYASTCLQCNHLVDMESVDCFMILKCATSDEKPFVLFLKVFILDEKVLRHLEYLRIGIHLVLLLHENVTKLYQPFEYIYRDYDSCGLTSPHFFFIEISVQIEDDLPQLKLAK